MNFLEKDLEDIIWETPNNQLVERGLDIIAGKKKRQLRIGNYGIADVVTFDRSPYIPSPSPFSSIIDITVYELKKDVIDVNTFLQGIRYIKGISLYIEDKYSFNHINYNLVLIGKEIEKKSSFVFLPDVINSGGSFDLSFYTYHYNFDGIKFTEHSNYSLIDEGFDDEVYNNHDS